MNFRTIPGNRLEAEGHLDLPLPRCTRMRPGKYAGEDANRSLLPPLRPSPHHRFVMYAEGAICAGKEQVCGEALKSLLIVYRISSN
jgi:hypothetical protein